MIFLRLPSGFVTFCILLILGNFLVACTQISTKDVVAEVNGIPICFDEMNAQRDMLFQGLSSEGLPPNDEELRQQYGYALTNIINQELVRQYLQKKKIPIDESQTVKEEVLVQGDYASLDEFKETLIQGGISLELWHQMMQRRQHILTLVNHILRPTVTIPSEKIEQYYVDHKDEFYVSDQLDFLYIISADKEKVAQARDIFLETQDAAQARFDAEVTVRHIRMGFERLPENIIKEASLLAPHAASPIKRWEEMYHTIILRERIPAGALDIAQTFKRIEQVLVEDQLQELLQSWLDKAYSKATIKVVMPLLQEIEIPIKVRPSIPKESLLEEEELEDDEAEQNDTYDVEFFIPADTITEPESAVDTRDDTN